MLCKGCGALLEEGTKFCGMCGYQNDAEETVAEAETGEMDAVQAEYVEENTEEFAKEEAKVEALEVTEAVAEKVTEAVIEEANQETVTVSETDTTEAINTLPDIQKAEPKKKSNFARGFLSVLCAVMIFVFTVCTIGLFVVREGISPKKTESIIDNADVEALMEYGGLDYYIDAKPKAAAKIFEEKEIRDFVKALALQYTEYLRGGDEPLGVDADELTTLIGKYAYEIEEITGERVTKRDYKNIQKYFGEDSAEIMGVLSRDVRTNGTLKTIRGFLSIYAIIGFGVLVLVFAFLLLKARKSRIDSLIWIAVPMLLAATIITVFGTIQPLTLMTVSSLHAAVGIVVKMIMENIFDIVLIGGIAGMGIGIILIISYIIAKKSSKKEKPRRQK